jgi:ABC-type multidrug transport system ATPase subunit
VGVINHGQLLAVGSPQQLRSRTSEPRLYLTGKFPQTAIEQVRACDLVGKMEQQDSRLILDLKDINRSHEIVTLLVKSGAEIDEVQKEQADLEEVFLSLVDEENRAEK